jgi:leucine dehydrogenase
VGYHLARFLHEAGAKLVYSDINHRNVKKALESWEGEVVEGDDVYRVDCDVFAPCAIGGIVNKRTIDLIRAPIVAGGANNVLEDEESDSVRLVERGITYAPDYVINAGGLMSVYAELRNWPAEKAMDDAENVFNTVKRVLHKAQAESVSTITASNRLAEERIEAVAALRRLRVSDSSQTADARRS